MDIVTLYGDEEYTGYLETLADRNHIREFDDFRQDVFLEITECDYRTMGEYKRAARRVATRHYRDKSNYDDISYYAYIDDEDNRETEEETMSRLVYQGRAVKVG